MFYIKRHSNFKMYNLIKIEINHFHEKSVLYKKYQNNLFL